MTARAFRWWGPLSVVLITLAADQATKAWARDALAAGPITVIDGLWDWQLGFNRGMAFSLFGSGAARIVLSVVALLAVVVIAALIARTRPDQRLHRLALSLAAAGALGNLLDRLRSGAVTDFILWHYHAHRWPIFNLADVALFVAVALLLVSLRRPAANESG